MKRMCVWLVLTGVVMTAVAQQMVSPNGKLTVNVAGSELNVAYQKQQVMKIETSQLSASVAAPKAIRIKDDYQMVIGKRLHCTNQANEYQWSVSGGGELVMRVYNDGLAFRYNGLTGEEPTTYVIPEGTRRWIQQWTDGMIPDLLNEIISGLIIRKEFQLVGLIAGILTVTADHGTEIVF